MHPQSRKTEKDEKKPSKFELKQEYKIYLLMSPITHAKVANKAETSLQLSETESQ